MPIAGLLSTGANRPATKHFLVPDAKPGLAGQVDRCLTGLNQQPRAGSNGYEVSYSIVGWRDEPATLPGLRNSASSAYRPGPSIAMRKNDQQNKAASSPPLFSGH